VNIGAAHCGSAAIVNVAATGELGAYVGAVEIAVIVVVAETGIGPEYTFDAVVGVDPSVVK
jgi:hypothetical protein